MCQVARGDTVKPMHPFLQSAVVRVDVLDMVNPCNHANPLRQIHRAMTDPHLPRHRAQCATAIRAENGIGCQKRLQDGADMFLVRARQHEVRCAARTIPTNQYRNLFVRQAALGGLAAPLAGGAGKPALLAFERFQEDRFVGLGNARQQRRPLRIGQVEKTVTPAERGIAMRL